MKFLFILLFATLSYSQNIFHSTQFEFAMQEPSGWIKAEQNEAIKNLKDNIKLPEETINKAIENNKGTIEIITFFKYPLNSVNGVVPTIKVNLRKNPAKTIDNFKKMMENSITTIKKTFPKFKVTKMPTVIQLDGKNCVYFESVNFIPNINGEEEVRTITYAVPVGNKFFQINFMDTKEDDNGKIFSEIIKTIQL